VSDPLGQLAASLRRPPASLTAFSALEPAQLRALADAIEATCERRQRQIDAELTRALPALSRSMLVPLLRGPGVAAIRRAVIAPSRPPAVRARRTRPPCRRLAPAAAR
jgi:hypothetical protein